MDNKVSLLFTISYSICLEIKFSVRRHSYLFRTAFSTFVVSATILAECFSLIKDKHCNNALQSFDEGEDRIK